MSILSAQRGAIPINLDKPRTLFFDASATFILYARYGMGFAAELYTVVDTGKLDGKGKPLLSVSLNSAESLGVFLQAGLQAEAIANGETLTLAQCNDFIRPWTLPPIFTAVMQAFTGATYVPPVKEGKDEAVPASPPQTSPKRVPFTKKKTKPSTLKTPSGLRLRR